MCNQRLKYRPSYNRCIDISNTLWPTIGVHLADYLADLGIRRILAQVLQYADQLVCCDGTIPVLVKQSEGFSVL